MNRSKFLVILGIGNSIRKDDGAGIRVVENLELDEDLKKFNICFRFLNTGGFDILDLINGYKHAIIVDAASMEDQGLKPGEYIHIANLNSLDRKESTNIFSHGIGILEILNYANLESYEMPHQIEIFGIQIKEIDCFSEILSPEVEECVVRLTKLLKSRIINYFSDNVRL